MTPLIPGQNRIAIHPICVKIFHNLWREVKEWSTDVKKRRNQQGEEINCQDGICVRDAAINLSKVAMGVFSVCVMAIKLATVRWGRSEARREGSGTTAFSSGNSYLLLFIPHLPTPALIQLQTARLISIHPVSSATGRLNWNCYLFFCSATIFLLDLKNTSSLFQPHTDTLLLRLKMGGKVDAISLWYTILPNWREITVSGAARRTTSRKTIDGPQPN